MNNSNAYFARDLNETKHFVNHGLYKVCIEMTKRDNLGIIIFNVSQYNSMFGITIVTTNQSSYYLDICEIGISTEMFMFWLIKIKSHFCLFYPY